MRNLGVAFEEVNYAKASLDEATILEIVKIAGGVDKVINTRHATAIANAWKGDKMPTDKAYARAAAAEPNLLRRPIVISGKMAIVGFSEAQYRKL